MAKRKKDDDDMAVDAPDEAEEESFEQPRPRKGVTPVTLILCFLNIVAAVGFVYLLAMDYTKRQAWSFAIFKYDLVLMGLPLEEEGQGPSASQVTFPRIKLDEEQLKKAFSQRGGKGFSEKFQPAVLTISHPIRPQDLSKEVLDDLFKGTGQPPVRTLEKEVQRLKESLPTEIADAAEKQLEIKKTEAEKRAQLEDLILRLAYDVHQVEALEKKLKEVKTEDLDKEIKSAEQRRILFDILAPLDMLRPAELKDRSLEQVANYDTVPLLDLYKLLDRRLSALLDKNYDGTLYFSPDFSTLARASFDKRRAIATTLFAITQARTAKGAPLYSGERLQAVVGLYEYALAGPSLTAALLGLRERIVRGIILDRDGSTFESKEGKIEANPGFVVRYERELRRLQDLANNIRRDKDRHEELLAQLKEHQEVVKERKERVQEITKKLVEERAKTAELMKQADQLRQQVFEARRRLLDAHQRNLAVEEAIGRWEGRKGGKRP